LAIALHEIISNRDKKSLWELNKVIERLTASSRTWKVSPSSALVKHFQSDILQRVKEIVTDDKNDDQMVDRLLELKEFIDECLSPEWLDDVEKNNKKYSYATTEAFEKGFTHRKLKPAEMIGNAAVSGSRKLTDPFFFAAKRIDALMKGGQKNASDADFFTNMKRVLKLYRFSPGELTHGFIRVSIHIDD
jgi:cullin-4